MSELNAFERFLLKQRKYCESASCMKEASTVIKVDGRMMCFCNEHDPEHVQAFSAWLDAHGDSIEQNKGAK